MANDSASRQVTVCHPNGLHLRPAHALTTLASKFKSVIEIVRDGENADAKSILSVMGLAAEQGTQLIIQATGDDANAALDALGEWFAQDTAEDSQTNTEQSETDGQKIT
jgi:phosphocarrier protein FPr